MRVVHQTISFVHFFFFFSSRRRHTRCSRDWSSDVCSSDLCVGGGGTIGALSRFCVTTTVPLLWFRAICSIVPWRRCASSFAFSCTAKLLARISNVSLQVTLRFWEIWILMPVKSDLISGVTEMVTFLVFAMGLGQLLGWTDLPRSREHAVQFAGTFEVIFRGEIPEVLDHLYHLVFPLFERHLTPSPPCFPRFPPR